MKQHLKDMLKTKREKEQRIQQAIDIFIHELIDIDIYVDEIDEINKKIKSDIQYLGKQIWVND